MAWYEWRPYVPVAVRRQNAARQIARFRKKGAPLAPVLIQGRTIARSFWGKAWCDNLERYSDYANRLPRGRTYVRNGSVVDLRLVPGQVHAQVAGSELYTVKIDIARMTQARWHRVVARCTGKIGSLVGLLRGELSSEVLAVLTHPKDGLFPEPREITMKCSCPDWAEMCKHVAAALYGVGARLDHKPELFFTLRQVDQTELLARATSGAVSRAVATTGKRIAAHKLADVFGIEIDDAPPTRAPAGTQTVRRQRRPRRALAPPARGSDGARRRGKSRARR
jgi:uncharacterized Zn finger protein